MQKKYWKVSNNKKLKKKKTKKQFKQKLEHYK